MLFRHFLVIGIGQGVSMALQICGESEGKERKKSVFRFNQVAIQ